MRRIAAVSTLLMVWIVASRAAAEDLTAEDYVSYWRPFIGAWKDTLEIEGKTFQGSSSIRLSPTKKCLIVSGDGCGVFPAFHGIHGFNPVTKHWQTAEYDAEGAYSTANVIVIGMKKGARFGKGSVFRFEGKKATLDGKVVEGTATVTCEECTKDRLVFIVTNVKEGDKKMPNFRQVSKRQPRQKRKPRNVKKAE